MKTYLIGAVLFVQATVALADIDTPSATSKEEPSTSRGLVSASAGCLGGAALGTVFPGIGNLIGCVVGGLSVWWIRSPGTPEPEKSNAMTAVP